MFPSFNHPKFTEEDGMVQPLIIRTESFQMKTNAETYKIL